MNLTRRAALAGGLAACVPATALRAAETRKLRVSIQPIIDCVPFAIAQKQGFFAQEGLEIDTSTSTGGAVGIPGLIGNAYDVVYSNVVSSILALGQGLDVQVFAPGAKIPAGQQTSEIVGLQGAAWRAPADFAGKTIAVNTRNGIVWLYARAWIKARGGDPAKVSFREVPFPQMEDALKARNADAAFMVEPFKSAALKAPGLAVAGSPFAEVQPGADVGHYLSTSKFGARDGDALRRFARAVRKGVDWYNANLGNKDGAQAVSDFTRLPVALVQEIKLPPMPTRVDPSQLRRTADLMKDNGLLAAAPDLDRFLSRAVLE